MSHMYEARVSECAHSSVSQLSKDTLHFADSSKVSPDVPSPPPPPSLVLVFVKQSSIYLSTSAIHHRKTRRDSRRRHSTDQGRGVGPSDVRVPILTEI